MSKRKKATGHRSNDRGTLRIDLVFRGVGRIAKATGTDDPPMLALYVGMCKTLYAVGRIDLLKALKLGTITFAELWQEYAPRKDRPVDLNRLPSAETMLRLWGEHGAFAKWIAGRKVSPTHRLNLTRDAKALEKHAKGGKAVADLPAILTRYKAVCEEKGTHRAFNMARTTCEAFLRAIVKRSHPLYGEVLEIDPLEETRKRGNPFTPSELRDWLDAMRKTLPADYADAFLAMCVTGMRPTEYWGAWEIQADRIRVRTAKQRTGKAPVWRDLPLVVPIAVPRVVWATFRDQWWKKGLAGQGHAIYDARRTFLRACEELEIPKSRRDAYTGHGPKTMDDLYTRHDVSGYLVGDAKRLRKYFGLDGQAKRLRRIG